jgi:hypothetical protein
MTMCLELGNLGWFCLPVLVHERRPGEPWPPQDRGPHQSWVVLSAVAELTERLADDDRLKSDLREVLDRHTELVNEQFSQGVRVQFRGMG